MVCHACATRKKQLLTATQALSLRTALPLRWPVLRILVLLDAAAAPLDARCLQTFANTGDCAARCACNDASNKHHGNITRLILSSDLAIRAEPLQPPLRCPQRHPKRLNDLLAAEALGGHSFNGEEFTCRSHHSRDEKCLQTLGCETNVAVVFLDVSGAAFTGTGSVHLGGGAVFFSIRQVDLAISIGASIGAARDQLKSFFVHSACHSTPPP